MYRWKNSTAALIVIYCLLQESHLIKGTDQRRTTQILSEPRIESSWPAYSNEKGGEAKVTAIGKAREFAKGEIEEQNKVIATNITEEKLNDFLNSFVAFPIFPFPFPEFKRVISPVNNTEKLLTNVNAKLTSDKSIRKVKPFSFFDFAFNIREAPTRNRSGEVNIVTVTNNDPENFYIKGKSNEMNVPFDIFDDDWSFFDDSPMFSPDMDEFLPKPDFLFFDFPFRKKRNRKLTRWKRGMTTPVVKSDLNFIMDIFDEALSRTKKEMEKPVPFWEFLSKAGRNVQSEERVADLLDKATPDDRKTLRIAGKHANDKRGMKRSRDAIHQKSPVVLGKIFEIGEIHFGNDHPKTKKKRRNAPLLGKKGNREVQDASFEVIQMNRPLKFEFFPKHLDFTPLHNGLKEVFHRIHQEGHENVQVKNHDSNWAKVPQNRDESKILDLMTEWDRRELEALTASTETVERKTHKMKGIESTRINLDHESLKEGFKFVGHTPKWKQSSGGNLDTDILQPENSYQTSKKFERGNDNSEKETTSREKVKRNITDVLGQFLSIITKLGDTKSFYQDKEVEGNGLEMEESLGSYSRGGMKLRKARNTLAEEVSHPVADLNYLFLTVTLPTMFAFTLLLAVCFFNLKIRGWLCTKLFKPRHVYVVERDIEKADKNAPEREQIMIQSNGVKNIKLSKENAQLNRETPEKLRKSSLN